MTTIVTIAGDALDELVAEHYGLEAVTAGLAAVIAANIGVAANGPILPAGVRIVLPVLPAAVSRPRLW